MGAPEVFPIGLGFVKAFLVRGTRDVLVDAGMKGSGPRLRAALERLGTGLDRLALVVITHGHLDHTGGLAEIVPSIACPVAVHRGDAELLRTGRQRPFTPVSSLFAALVRLAPRRAAASSSAGIEPGIVLEDAFDLSPYGVDGTVEATPGHTAGSISLFLAGGDAIVGDALRGAIGRASAPRWPFVVEDFVENRKSVERMLARRPSRIWTSHGGPLALETVRRFVRS
jgi:hydroxyacylglutathione hydrolase